MTDATKQFRNGVAWGKLHALPPWLYLGYFWGMWIGSIEKAFDTGGCDK